jgi:ribosome-binding protein aMBF1 (putative translation factor)
MESQTVIRCKACDLNQFLTRSELCRRCRQPLLAKPVVVEEPRPVAALPPLPDRPAIDMGRAVWLLRSALGLSQRQMARKMGIARTYISKLEGNRCMPSTMQVSRLAGTLGVSEYCLVTLATLHQRNTIN